MKMTDEEECRVNKRCEGLDLGDQGHGFRQLLSTERTTSIHYRNMNKNKNKVIEIFLFLSKHSQDSSHLEALFLSSCNGLRIQFPSASTYPLIATLHLLVLSLAPFGKTTTKSQSKTKKDHP